ncbi:hypothetical protein PPL_01406 [Heterostelium album PN500]|uniref:IPT/TIG domain-containing protein n=1 Tax=Heterostelium pallidum (strain ATCC 26659 / Pp 5 / PN500) TaxID=670386 RepID=D3AZ66_HETP5|nr:hypothetical protein PPL_01406 [Heterostelium album PN500]EFA85449.1 hypothetical protein PPL_01406 [Heterostelium album PN500]|eukprot:XP_020437558.1 hypothetical protein PPL_01406 [Heterostelium album PN500]
MINKSLILFIIFGIFLVQQCLSDTQIPAWNVSGYSYVLKDAPVSYDISLNMCLQIGAIASLSNKKEADYIVANSNNFTNTLFWIGIQSLSSNGNGYTYESGTSLDLQPMYDVQNDTCITYCPWGPGEPINFGNASLYAVAAQITNGQISFRALPFTTQLPVLCLELPSNKKRILQRSQVPTTGGSLIIVVTNTANITTVGVFTQDSPPQSYSGIFQYKAPQIIGFTPKFNKGEVVTIRGVNFGVDPSLISVVFGNTLSEMFSKVACSNILFLKGDQITCTLNDNIVSPYPINIMVDGIQVTSTRAPVYLDTVTFEPPDFSIFNLQANITKFTDFISSSSYIDDGKFFGVVTSLNQFNLLQKIVPNSAVIEGLKVLSGAFFYSYGPNKDVRASPYFKENATSLILDSPGPVLFNTTDASLSGTDNTIVTNNFFIQYYSLTTARIIDYTTNASNYQDGTIVLNYFLNEEFKTITLNGFSPDAIYGQPIYTENQLILSVKAGIFMNYVYLTLNGQQTNTIFYKNNFYKPIINSYQSIQKQGESGNVTIFGNHFMNTSMVSIGNYLCNALNFVDSQTLVCLFNGIPLGGKDALPIRVSTNVGAVTAYIFYYKQYFECANPTCSGNGVCNHDNGQCQCRPGFYLWDCSMKSTQTLPPPPLVNNNGGAVLVTKNDSVETSKFNIDIQYIREIDSNGNTLKLVNVSDIDWTLIQSNTTYYIYTGQIANSSTTIQLNVNIFNTSTSIVFAGETIQMDANSVKFQVTISSWPFKDQLSTLEVIYSAQLVQNQDICSTPKVLSDGTTSNSASWYQVQIGTSILSARFARYLFVNGRITKSNVILLDEETDPLYQIVKSNSTDQTKYTLLTAIQVPYFDSQCILDPNFSLLLTGDPEQCDSKKNNWKVPVIVVCSVVGGLLLITVAVIMFTSLSVTFICLIVFLINICVGDTDILFPAWNVTGYSYRYLGLDYNYNGALTQCQGGGFLATITSKQEADFIRAELETNALNDPFWISIQAASLNGTGYSYDSSGPFSTMPMYTAQNDQCYTFCPWSDGHPVIGQSNNAVAAQLQGDGTLQFISVPRTNSYKALCVEDNLSIKIVQKTSISSDGGQLEIFYVNPQSQFLDTCQILKWNDLTQIINLPRVKNGTFQVPPGTGLYKLKCITNTQNTYISIFQYNSPLVIGFTPKFQKDEILVVRGQGFGNDINLISMSIGNVQCRSVQLSGDQLSCTLSSDVLSPFPLIISVDGMEIKSYRAPFYLSGVTNNPPNFALFTLNVNLTTFLTYIVPKLSDQTVYFGALTEASQYNLVSKIFPTRVLTQGVRMVSGGSFYNMYGPSKNSLVAPYYYGTNGCSVVNTAITLSLTSGSLMDTNTNALSNIYFLVYNPIMSPTIVGYTTNASNYQDGYAIFDIDFNQNINSIQVMGLVPLYSVLETKIPIVLRVAAGINTTSMYFIINGLNTNQINYTNNLYSPTINRYQTNMKQGETGNVTIFGDHFMNTSQITIGGAGCDYIVYLSPQQLICSFTGTPVGGKDALPIAVSNNVGTTTSYLFFYRQYYECANPTCSGNGVCNHDNGQCQCRPGFYLWDCSMKSTQTLPPPPLVNNNGGAVLVTKNDSVETSKFNIDIQYIREIDSNGNTLKLVNVSDIDWTLIQSNTTYYIYTGQIANSSTTIQLNVNIFNISTSIVFAGETIQMDANSVKFQVTISSWPFKDQLSTLEVIYSAQLLQNQDICSTPKVLSDGTTSNSASWYQVQIGTSILSARFARYLFVNGRITKSNVILLDEETDPLYQIVKSNSTDQTKYTLLTAIQVPYFDSQCILDPNFSLLLTGDPEQCDSKKNNWKVPVIVVCSVVGGLILITVAVVIIKKQLKGRKLIDMAVKLKRKF